MYERFYNSFGISTHSNKDHLVGIVKHFVGLSKRFFGTSIRRTIGRRNTNTHSNLLYLFFQLIIAINKSGYIEKFKSIFNDKIKKKQENIFS